MLGSKRPVFKPTAYGYARRKRRIPRWLVLILTGIALGAGGLLFLQTSYGPTRLTAEQSEQLHFDLNSANNDKQRLQTDLTHTTRQFEDAQSAKESLHKEVQSLQAERRQLQADLALFADAMPPDPRGTSPGIRAGDFTVDEGLLSYSLLIMQDKGKTTAFTGKIELVVAGRYTNGRSATIELAPIEQFNVERYEYVQGETELPAGFTPRQITIRIKPTDSERVVATRTLFVNR